MRVMVIYMSEIVWNFIELLVGGGKTGKTGIGHGGHIFKNVQYEQPTKTINPDKRRIKFLVKCYFIQFYFGQWIYHHGLFCHKATKIILLC